MIKNCFYLCLLALIGSLVSAGNSYAKGLDDVISESRELNINYGINEYIIAGRRTIISKALYKRENFEVEEFSVLQADGEAWQIAKFDDRKDAVWGFPAGYEANSRLVKFMVPKGKSLKGKYPKLYLLEILKEGEASSMAYMKFNLYELVYSGEFGILSLKKIDTAVSKKKYCNVGAAENEILRSKEAGREDDVCEGM